MKVINILTACIVVVVSVAISVIVSIVGIERKDNEKNY